MRTIQPPFLAHDVVWAPGGRARLGDVGLRAPRSPSTRATRASPLQRLPAGSAPQHVAFLGSRAYVASGKDGVGAACTASTAASCGGDVAVPVGSYNISFAGPDASFAKPVGVTPSLDRGTVCLLSPAGDGAAHPARCPLRP